MTDRVHDQLVESRSFDPAKDAANIATHGISLRRWTDLDIVAFAEDVRFDYGEQRFRAWGFIGSEAHCLAYTVRDGRIRPISLRRAHAKEIRRYASWNG